MVYMNNPYLNAEPKPLGINDVTSITIVILSTDTAAVVLQIVTPYNSKLPSSSTIIYFADTPDEQIKYIKIFVRVWLYV